MLKVGIITWHDHNNMGGALQAFALTSIVRRFTDSVQIIDYHDKAKVKVKLRIQFFLSKIGNIFNLNWKFRYPFLDFYHKYYKLTRQYDLKTIWDFDSSSIDLLICGSDQIWAPNKYSPVYFGEFYRGRKVSYAASIGLNYIPRHLIDSYKNALETFELVTVREEKAVELLRDKCGITAQCVLDPTLLLNVEDYKLIESPVSDIRSPFVFCYFLNEKNVYKQELEHYLSNCEFEIVGYSKKTDDSHWIRKLKNIGPKEFLWLVHNAALVITDSYHGSVFSLLYHKKAYIFRRFEEDDPINQNSRIEQLSSYGFIGKSQIKGLYETFIDRTVEEFEKELGILRARSLAYIEGIFKSC